MSLPRFLAPLLAVGAAAVLFGGCQAIFTFSPLSGLQRDPSTLSPEQRLTYAQDALASGDADAMKKAYDAIKSDSGADAQYVTAQLGIELSGVPTILREVAGDTSTLTAQLDDIDTFISDHHLDPTYMVDAYGQLVAAEAAGASLTTMDYVMGSMGLLLGDTGGTWDITGVPAGSGADAQTYLQPAWDNVQTLPSGDPLRTFVEDYYNYVGTLP